MLIISNLFSTQVLNMGKHLDIFFKILAFTLKTAAAFPQKKPLRSELNTFLLYKVWPVLFIGMWGLMVPMVLLKLVQFINKEQWEDVLETIHMFFVGVYTLYSFAVVQRSAVFYKNTIDTIQTKFTVGKSLSVHDIYIIVIMWMGFGIAYVLYIGTCIYYGEVLVPVWVPFIDNDKELPNGAFYFIWVYQGGAGYYMFCCLGIWGPFVIVATTCIVKELEYLIQLLEEFPCPYQCHPKLSNGDMRHEWYIQHRIECEQTEDYSNPITHNFIRNLVEHHILVQRALREVSRIHSPVFLIQTAATVVHSCFLTFNMYYTTRLGKVLIKSSPILFESYFIMFIYYWNGQQLTNKCEELYRAMYRCPWYSYPRRFRTSLLLMIEMNKQPVHLSAFGIFPATLELFLTCLQQSVSYIMLLVTLTRNASTTADS